MHPSEPQPIGGVPVDIRPIRPGEERAAGDLVYRVTRGKAPSPAQLNAFMAQTEALETDLANQAVAVTPGGELVGCAMLFPNLDATASISAPMCVEKFRSIEVEVGLVRTLREMAARRGIQMLQALTAEDDGALEEIFMLSGFEVLATMLFMERPTTRDDRKWLADSMMRWQAYSPERHGAFLETVERSYEGTLDCSKLGEFRNVSTTIESYKARGAFDPDLWLLGEQDGKPAAVILLVRHPDGTHEVAYMGVVPEQRGKGLGLETMKRALAEVASRGGDGLVSLVVDEANTPATAVYSSLGFAVTERRRAYFSLLATS